VSAQCQARVGQPTAACGALSVADTCCPCSLAVSVDRQLDSGREAVHRKTVRVLGRRGLALFIVSVIKHRAGNPDVGPGLFLMNSGLSAPCVQERTAKLLKLTRLYHENRYRLIHPGPLADPDHPS